MGATAERRVPRGAAALYAGAGAEFAHYEVDVANATLVKRGAVTLPANVQYAWPHHSGRYLYVASSNGGPGKSGDQHYVSAFRVAASGALTAHGAPVPLPARPLHLATDIASAHVLIAYNLPSSLTVHRLNADGTLGDEVKQPALDTGIYAHQVRVDPTNRTAVLVTRGNSAAGGKPEDPGALKFYDYRDGVLANRLSYAPNGGIGYGPRHLDFHPEAPWLFVSLELQNKFCVYKWRGEPAAPQLLYTRETLIDAGHVRPPRAQLAGTLHVHPNGRTVYVANRASSTAEVAGQKVFAGGENNIAVYAVNPGTGEPSLIQHIDTRGLQPRTFALDPSGRLLVVANAIALKVQDRAQVTTVPASLAVFRVGDDGRLAYARKYDVETGGATLFWMGMVGL
jgi:6-phosphogluconolactonase (cycloisomerase 2 family)